VRTNTLVGRTLTAEDLFGRLGFDAVFLGLGAGAPIFLGVPGENLPGVMSANEFLTRVNLMQAFREDYDTPVQRGRNVVVIGGGNVAMDASRSAVRLGAETATLLYRRTRAEMPARVEEVRHAEEEGVVFEFLVAPVRFLGEERRLAAVECLRMQLGEPDESGRRRPIPIEGSEFTIGTDQAIVAVGARVNPSARLVMPAMEQDEKGHITVDPETHRTNVPGVFAGGDVVAGEETVIRALSDGRRAASAINEYLGRARSE
jgi:glutamate synthase (NADPH/NADH) small chain